ncbi:cadherin-like domain-containing protein, partial [Azohydromonas caseinilytica]
SAALSVSTLTVDHGTAAQNADGSWTITPAANYHGALKLSYGVSDGKATTAATLGLTLASVEDAPAASGTRAQLAAGSEDTAYTVTLAQLLQGFTDGDGDRLSITTLTVDHGTAAQNADGSWTITPEANYSGALVLSYGVTDGQATTAATLGLALNAVNDAPVLSGAQAQLAEGSEDTAYTVTLAQLLQGFGDVDSATLSVASLAVDHGTAVRNADGSWTITPAANHHGALVLSYLVSDGQATTAATLNLTLAGVEDAPVLGGEPAVLAAAADNRAYTVSLAQLLQGFADGDGDALWVTGLTVDHGTAQQNADGSWTITLEAGYLGALTLSYGVTDGQATTAATLLTQVVPGNDAPVLSGEPATLQPGSEDASYTVTLAQLLQGFTDVDSTELSVASLTLEHGTAVQNADGSWTITPEPDYHGTLVLSYVVSDGVDGTPATLALELGAVNDAPVLAGEPAVLPQASMNHAYTVTLEQLLQGFADVDGDQLSVTQLTLEHGTAVQNADGSWSITLQENYHGALVLSYVVSDGSASTAATLALDVNPGNEAPVLSTEQAWLQPGAEDSAYTVSLAQLLQGFADAEGDALSVTQLTVDHG